MIGLGVDGRGIVEGGLGSGRSTEDSASSVHLGHPWIETELLLLLLLLLLLVLLLLLLSCLGGMILGDGLGPFHHLGKLDRVVSKRKTKESGDDPG